MRYLANKKEIAKARIDADMTVSELADAVGISRQALNPVLQGRKDTAEWIAKKVTEVLKGKLGKLFKVSNVFGGNE